MFRASLARAHLVDGCGDRCIAFTHAASPALRCIACLPLHCLLFAALPARRSIACSPLHCLLAVRRYRARAHPASTLGTVELFTCTASRKSVESVHDHGISMDRSTCSTWCSLSAPELQWLLAAVAFARPCCMRSRSTPRYRGRSERAPLLSSSARKRVATTGCFGRLQYQL